MVETVIQKASLVGQIIEDLTYAELSPHRFQAEMMGVQQSPQYKQGGYFVFSDLAPGDYTLRIAAESYQPQQYPVTIPFAPLIFTSPGENELIVAVKTINGSRITFDPVILKKEIRTGSSVLANGLSTRLTARLDVGQIAQARLDSVAGLAAGSIVRIIRDQSIRMKFSPYASLPYNLTRIVGKVAMNSAPEIPLEGAQVRLARVNGSNVVFSAVAGAQIATVEVNAVKIVLGTDKDMITQTNSKGDYNLYLNRGDFLQNVTVSVTLDGYIPASKTEPIAPGQRRKIDFSISKV